MRRTDRQRIDAAFYDEVFQKATELFLAINDGKYPYCIPLNFARMNNKIYIHSALEGKKLDLLRQNGHVAFSMAVDMEIDRAKSTTYFKSVCGHGTAVIVDDKAEKGAALDAISLRYASNCPRPGTEANINSVAIIRIDIEELSGKCSQKKEDLLQA